MAESAGAPKDLIGFLDYYFVTKAPFQIPPTGREWLVRFGPWVVLVLLIFTVPPVLFLLKHGLDRPDAYYWGYAYGYWPWMLGIVLQFGLRAAALPGLFARRMSGWRLAFYAEVVGLVAAVLSMAIVSGLLSALIGFYILFQIRSLYK